MQNKSAARERTNDFSQGSLPRAILGMGLPLTAAQLINILYNIVDRMYIGHIPGAGALALTGLGLCLPVISIIGAFSRLCGTGGASLCSIERGRGDYEKAESIMGNSFCMLLIAGALLMVLGLVFMEPVLYAFGASAETYPYAASYCRIYQLGNIFVLISLGMNSYINAQGFSRIGMMTVALGAVLNIVLDPLFIFVLDMGVRGAALATVISQACSAAWVLRFLTGPRAQLKLRLRCMRLNGSLVRRILGMGTSGFVMSFTNSAVQITANRMLGLFGGDMYIAVMTIINSIREVVTMPIQGVTGGAEPVIGFNYGAARYDRVIGSVKFMTAVSIGYSMLVWALLMLLPEPLMRIFTSDETVLGLGKGAMRVYYMGYFLMSLQFAGQSTFVSLGRAKQAVFFSLLRKVIIVVPLMLCLPYVAGLGVTGVFLSEPISDLIGGVICYTTMLLTVVRPMLRQIKEKN